MPDHLRSHSDTLSLRLYRLLLQLYPRAFREEYAAEMLFAFRDAYHEAARQEGTPGILRIWRDIAYDLMKTACIERARSWMRQDDRHSVMAMEGQAALRSYFAVESAHCTDAGRVRSINEDSLLTLVPDDGEPVSAKGALFIVADGMGGQHGGASVSELAAQQIKASYYHDSQRDPSISLRDAFRRANDAILQSDLAKDRQNAPPRPTGTTCVAAVLREQTLYVANIGDSRAYVLHDGRLRQITRDHSVIAQLLERGEITPAQARTHAQRHLIYRALGMPDVEVDCYAEAVQEGDTLLLCTDGLTNQLEDEEICAIVEQHHPEESVQRLIARANERGGPDNITAVVVRIAAR